MKTSLHLRISLLCAAFVALFPLSQASAGIMLNGTRIILSGDQHSVSTIVSNQSASDYAVQAWINDALDSKERLTPFIAMPALFRVRSGEEQVVRIIKTPGSLPEDRESVFYFNAQEIPVSDGKQSNALKVAVRTRVKLFYRPKALQGTAQQAPAGLSWKLLDLPSGSILRVTNPSAYHITFIGIRLLDGAIPIELQDVDMVAPKSTRDYPLKQKIKSRSTAVEFSIINDYGGYSELIKSTATF